MLFIHCALHWEANPLIDRYRLKRDLSWSPEEIYRGKDLALVVSGIGYEKTLCSVASSLSRLYSSETLTKGCVALNFGTSGAREEFPIGDLLLPHRICCERSGKCFYPDITFRHSLNEVVLQSRITPASSVEDLPSDVNAVDMESSAFFYASGRVISPSRIFTLKVVSDHCKCSVLSKENVSYIIGNRIEEVSALVGTLQDLSISSPAPLTDKEEQELLSLRENLYLTTAEFRQVRELVIRKKLFAELTPDTICAKLQSLNRDTVKSKAQLFNAIEHELSSPTLSSYLR